MGIGKKPNQPEGDDKNVRAIGIDPDDPIMQANTMQQGKAQQTAVQSSEDMAKWLEEKAWKQPKWLKQTKSEKVKSSGYQGFYLNSLRARYLRLEGDFRTAFCNFYNTPYMDMVTARRIIDFLQTSREALEDNDCDVNDVITMLDMTDQYMVWIYPPHYAKAQVFGLAADLKGQNNPWGEYLERAACQEGQTLGGLRAALDKTKEAMNEAKQNAIISTGLQIERLNTARNWSWYVLIASLVFLPLVVRTDSTVWDNTMLSKFLPELRPWFAIICAAIFGAGGAFLSSLMAVQNSRTVLSDYQENLKNNQLKLNIGALAAIIIFIFLTWNLIPGVQMQNAGSLIFMAFIAGFSERFFLDLLNIKNDGFAPRPAPAPVATPPLSSTPIVPREAQPIEEVPNDIPHDAIPQLDVPTAMDRGMYPIADDVNTLKIN